MVNSNGYGKFDAEAEEGKWDKEQGCEGLSDRAFLSKR
jgi:hypothetical protein